MTKRERLYTIRMSEEETARLDEIAQHYGLTAAGVIRMLVKREADMILKPARSFADAMHKRSLRETLDRETKRSKGRKP